MDNNISFIVSLALIVVVISIPVFGAVRNYITTHQSATRREFIEFAIDQAVLAAEQLGLSGVEAKAYAIEAVYGILAEFKISVPRFVVEVLIESAVMRLFNSK